MYLSLLISAAAFLISVFSLIYFKSYLKRRTSQERILLEMREEVNNIILLINETTDRDISLIEEREKDLKTLLEETDKRLKLYIREMERIRAAEERYSTLVQDVPGRNQKSTGSSGEPVSDQAAASYLELGKNRYRHNKQKPPPGSGSSRISADTYPENLLPPDSLPAFPLPGFKVKTEPAFGPSSTGTFEPSVNLGQTSPQEDSSGQASLRQSPSGGQIRELIRAGFSPAIIASRLGISIAEVEFAAALLERQSPIAET